MNSPSCSNDEFGARECNNNNIATMHEKCGGGVLPKRIIVVRHGESQGNLDPGAYTTTPDYKIPLTSQGISQARLTGSQIRHLVTQQNFTPKEIGPTIVIGPSSRPKRNITKPIRYRD
jgi:hypothetical protein